MFSIETEKQNYSGPLSHEELAANESKLREAIAPMDIRDDSRLSWKYISQQTGRSLQNVAGEIVTVNMIYQHTTYAEDIEDSLRKTAAANHDVGVSWSAAWMYTKNYAVVSSKLGHLAALLRTSN